MPPFVAAALSNVGDFELTGAGSDSSALARPK
jgi:hypothetical protein